MMPSFESISHQRRPTVSPTLIPVPSMIAKIGYQCRYCELRLRNHRKKILLCQGQRTPLLCREAMSLFQRFQNVVRGIMAEIGIVNSHAQHLMKHCVDGANSIDGKALFINQGVVEPLYVRFYQRRNPLLAELRLNIHAQKMGFIILQIDIKVKTRRFQSN